MRTNKTNRFRARKEGFTLVELMIVVSILGLLVGLAFPNYVKSRRHAQKQLCIENLSQIETAKQLWGMEHNKDNGDVPEEADLIGATLYIKKAPVCPGGGEYRFEAIGTTATCTEEGHEY